MLPTKGVRSGFRPVHLPDRISAYDVVMVIDGGKLLFDCKDTRRCCPLFVGSDWGRRGEREGRRPIHAVTQQAEALIYAEFGKHTLQDLAMHAHQRRVRLLHADSYCLQDCVESPCLLELRIQGRVVNAMNDDVKELLDLLTGETLPEDQLGAMAAQVLKTYENANEEQDWLAGIRCEGGVPMLRLMYGIFYALMRDDRIATFGRWQDVHQQLCARFERLFPPVPAWVSYQHEYLSWAETECHRRGYELLEYPECLTADLHVMVVRQAHTPRLIELGRRFGIGFRPAFDSLLVQIRRGR
ncbi:hypothetical protein SAMN05216345_12619 [Cupriavidus sp. YR651]|nr:hypothetical protein SAMN05216345_12619 [Cupriavidus sp. YR651]